MQRNNDFIQHFIFEEADVRGKMVRLEKSTETIMKQHHYPLVIQEILGQLLTSAVLLSSTLKYKGQLTLQYQGKGALTLLVAKCTDNFDIRGLAQWDNNAELSEIKHAFFSGKLIITLENFQDNQRYQSIIEINHKTMSEAFEAYFTQSEQIPTKIILAHDKRHFSGFLIQKMPSHSSQSLDFWQHINILTQTLKAEELLKWNNETVLHHLFHEENIRLFEQEWIQFNCTCSEEKSKNSLRLLGQKDALDYFLTNKCLTISCDYCNQQYNFNETMVRQLFH